MIPIHPIGTVRTPFKQLEEMPIQPKGAAEALGQLVIDDAYKIGLKDLDGFSHLYLIYHFHKAARTELTVTPFMDTQPRGVFATRSPLRPSHIGISITELVAVEDNIVTVKGIDLLDGTPLLDIKPLIPQFDAIKGAVKTGWMKKTDTEVTEASSDGRFV